MRPFTRHPNRQWTKAVLWKICLWNNVKKASNLHLRRQCMLKKKIETPTVGFGFEFRWYFMLTRKIMIILLKKKYFVSIRLFVLSLAVFYLGFIQISRFSCQTMEQIYGNLCLVPPKHEFNLWPLCINFQFNYNI